MSDGEKALRGLEGEFGLEPGALSDEVKTRRAARIAEFKAELLKVMQVQLPDLKGVELTDTAAIEMFGMGLLDAPEPEWREFVDGLMDGTMVPLDEDDLDDEKRSSIEEGLNDVKKGRTI